MALGFAFLFHYSKNFGLTKKFDLHIFEFGTGKHNFVRKGEP